MQFDINYLAVLVSGLIVMSLGAFWYSPAGFGKPWMKLMGFTKESMEANQAKGNSGMWKYYLSAMLANLIMVFVLAHFVAVGQAKTAWEGSMIGFWAWLGFVAMPSLSYVIWEGRPWKLYAINVGYVLVSLKLAGAILAVWR